MTAETEPSPSILKRIDLLVILSSVVLLFVALGTEPWWTLTGATTNRLLNVQVSPFFLHINAVGIPTTTTLANSLGYITRTLVLLGFVSLFAAGLRPKAWWRNLALSLGFASLIELYLSFLLMYYWAETMFVSAYSAVPPFYGTSNLQANIIGLDLAYYSRPLVTATFSLPYYLGYLSIALAIGQTTIKLLRDHALRALALLLPGGGIHDIYLTPPYQNVWFSSGNRDYNPLGGDPEKLTDDELILSFQRLYDTVEPGGNLSILIPAWATTLSDRFQKLMPLTGFTAESDEIISGDDGEPESQLVFHRPEKNQEKPDKPPITDTPKPSTETIAAPNPAPAIVAVTEPSAPPVLEIAEKPAWTLAKMTHQEHEILKAAIEIIAQHKEPVSYRELLNQVYIDLVNNKSEFDSARQIEAILLDHNGREVQLVEEADNENARMIKSWRLGEEKLQKEGGRRLTDLKKVPFKLPKVGHVFRKPTTGYHSKKSEAYEENPESGSN